MQREQIAIPADHAVLDGELVLPPGARTVVLFAHGSGSSRFSPRNNYVASVLHEAGTATLLFDLLTREEDRNYESRFDITLLTRRLLAATEWVRQSSATHGLRIGYFGASTGAAAALQAAAEVGARVSAVVSRGGRPDLAGNAALEKVSAATLLIVGGEDFGVIELNESAYAQLTCEKKLLIVPGATHLFEEGDTLEQAARAASAWFSAHGGATA